MCLNHPRHRGAGVHVDKPSGATSELTVAYCVIGWTPELLCCARRDQVSNAQWTDELRVGDVPTCDERWSSVYKLITTAV